MAEGVPFLCPVVIDETGDAEAVVPSDFLNFQWMRLADGAALETLVERVKFLTSGVKKPSLAGTPAGVSVLAPRSKWISPVRAMVGAVALVVLVVAIVGWRSENQGLAVINQSEAETTESDDKSVAVMPFENLGSEESDAFFARGMHEDILVQLSQIEDLKVAAMVSVHRAQGLNLALPELGQRLHSRYVLTGSIRRSGEMVRIGMRHVDASRDQQVWAEIFDRNLDNIFATQSEISREVAAALQVQISPTVAATLDRVPTESPLAYDEYLKSRDELTGIWVSPVTLDRAEQRLRSALELDPNFVEAWSLLSVVYCRRAMQMWTMDETENGVAEARAAALASLTRAQALAPDQLATLQATGLYHFLVTLDYAQGVRAMDRAIRLVPTDLMNLMILGNGYRRMTRLDDAIEVLQKALAIDPTNGLVAMNLVGCYRDQGDYQAVENYYRMRLKQFPEASHFELLAKYYRFLHIGSLGAFRDYEKALQTTEITDQCDPSVWRDGRMTVALLERNFDSFAADWQEEWEAHHRGHGDWVCPLQSNDEANHAGRLLSMGKKDQAAEIVAKAAYQITRPNNPVAVCTFNSNVIRPKISFLQGNEVAARAELLAELERVERKSDSYLKFKEKAVLLEAADFVAPDLVYQHYRDIQRDPVRIATFEVVCANPWTFPHLISTAEFQSEVRRDGRFGEFLAEFGFMDL